MAIAITGHPHRRAAAAAVAPIAKGSTANSKPRQESEQRHAKEDHEEKRTKKDGSSSDINELSLDGVKTDR